jgi:hypothetical protein
MKLLLEESIKTIDFSIGKHKLLTLAKQLIIKCSMAKEAKEVLIKGNL